MTARISDADRQGKAVSQWSRYAWVLFEGGRNPYVLIVTVYVYATYFARDIVGDPVRGQALWADIQGFAGLFVAVLAPVLGAIADAGGRRKPWIAAFAVLMAAATALLWFGEPMGAGLGVAGIGAAVAMANVAYDGSLVFHSAMLPSLVPPDRIGRWSGAGYGLGNLAGIVLLLFILLFIYLPAEPLFGLDRASHEHERIVGPIMALWFSVLAIPFFLFTPDRPATRLAPKEAIARGIASVSLTLKSLSHHRGVARFLLARMIYNDGLNVLLAFGGIYAAGVFGWDETESALYGILLSVFAAIGGFLGGFLGDWIGIKRALLIALGGIILFALLSLGFTPDRLFFVFPYASAGPLFSFPYFSTVPELLYIASVTGVAVCLVACYTNSRALMAKIAPKDRMTEFFGLYALSGEATAFAAPLAVSGATRLTGSQQGSMAAILLFLAAGFILLLRVREED